MASNSSTPEKIAEGAIRAMGRYGVRKFSMSDICTEAGVSRGTLYRYFKSKDQVLEAVGEYVDRTFRTTLKDAVTGHPDPEDRLEVVLQALLDYRTTHPDMVRIVDAEPSFVLDFLSQQFATLLAIISEALDPVLKGAPPVRDGTLTKRQLAEMFIRLTLSVYLVPSSGSDQTARRVAALWRSVTATPESTARFTRAAG
ncbi:TetR/AcrR family transcriptional regulator [Streptomyces phaeochromogenes]|uniref:TetR/AcrR family transcriptional regulator n=1 Tax=Streptomyces phaeochromogenes TaxID=1923 RepID=UPI002DD8A1A4|nr:TetR/AcrR family transcriptional regulator [Streptomyces phaeochromogenes]WRZ34600.1 TetR/AcrR family transcriptional regulator [Streptomyces phaeochromogenes]